MIPKGDSCEVCGGTDWTVARGHWKRCDNCSHMDTTIPERICEVCGCPVGRFAKPTINTCIDCRQGSGFISKRCSTRYCGGKVRVNSTTLCDGCLNELKVWKMKGGPRWKYQAMKLFYKPTQLKDSHRQLQIDFPQLSMYKVVEWIRRQIKLGNLVKLKFGIYQTKESQK